MSMIQMKAGVKFQSFLPGSEKLNEKHFARIILYTMNRKVNKTSENSDQQKCSIWLSFYLRSSCTHFSHQKTNKTHSIRISCFNILKQPDKMTCNAKSKQHRLNNYIPVHQYRYIFGQCHTAFINLTKRKKYTILINNYIVFTFFFSSSLYSVLLVFLTSLRKLVLFFGYAIKMPLEAISVSLSLSIAVIKRSTGELTRHEQQQKIRTH